MSPAARRAVFLDRDGTVMEDREYLSDPAGVRLVPGAAEAIGSLRAAGLAVVVVTNQSGIARGLYREEDYHAVAARLDEALEERGVAVDGTWYCPHHPAYTGPCRCRKPGTGMYEEAAAELGLSLEGSYYVGDKLSDVLPAVELGGRGVLVRTGYGAESVAEVRERAPGVEVVDDVAAAARWILGREEASRRTG